jgi:hypothetical protein
MMYGFVNQRCEAVIRIAVGHANNPKQMIETVIDTGFTGFLSLPFSTICYWWNIHFFNSIYRTTYAYFSALDHADGRDSSCIQPFYISLFRIILKSGKLWRSIPTTLNLDIAIDSNILLDRLAMSVIRWRSLSSENRASRSLGFDCVATT